MEEGRRRPSSPHFRFRDAGCVSCTNPGWNSAFHAPYRDGPFQRDERATARCTKDAPRGAWAGRFVRGTRLVRLRRRRRRSVGGEGLASLLRLLAGHFFEDGADFLRPARVERVRLEQVEDQQAGLALVELIHQAADPLLTDLL